MFLTSCLWPLCGSGDILTLQLVTLTQQFSLFASAHIAHLCTLALTVLKPLGLCIAWLMVYLSELMYLDMLTIHGRTDPLTGMQKLPIDQITYLVCEPIHCVTCESTYNISLAFSEMLQFVLRVPSVCKLWPLDRLGQGLSGNLERLRNVKFLPSLSRIARTLQDLQISTLTQIAVQTEIIACNLLLPLHLLIQYNCSLWHTLIQFVIASCTYLEMTTIHWYEFSSYMLIQCTYQQGHIVLNAYMEMITIQWFYKVSNSSSGCSFDMIELAAMSTYLVCLTIHWLRDGYRCCVTVWFLTFVTPLTQIPNMAFSMHDKISIQLAPSISMTWFCSTMTHLFQSIACWIHHRFLQLCTATFYHVQWRMQHRGDGCLCQRHRSSRWEKYSWGDPLHHPSLPAKSTTQMYSPNECCQSKHTDADTGPKSGACSKPQSTALVDLVLDVCHDWLKPRCSGFHTYAAK